MARVGDTDRPHQKILKTRAVNGLPKKEQSRKDSPSLTFPKSTGTEKTNERREKADGRTTGFCFKNPGKRKKKRANNEPPEHSKKNEPFDNRRMSFKLEGSSRGGGGRGPPKSNSNRKSDERSRPSPGYAAREKQH